ncbi:DUF1853 family protein [Herbaspirillum sp. RTI4]|uniref:DUF1853 family protein n=1 Tax=Herbaspirillum sp. RTI4 TaxID=3048640 RepID=UPI002AB5C8CC|nr:DUF1853 family protein [Herbaspirillum sp. RTI4]MDY7578652.1 DUF1853 family protein [Herbaspirillum sp. RTI4]MEA9980650.1 DUF1853 family protein [Herbaspirillum sp. RTI4]
MPPDSGLPVPFNPYQLQFHQRWGHLRDPHVRALTFLLDAPELLDAMSPQWSGRIAVLDVARHGDPELAGWLAALDAAPQALHAILAAQSTARLGRYAEQLLTFYLRHAGRLVAHNLQVRSDAKLTVGEFDFLLPDASGTGLLHWEFATKFYLLESASAASHMEGFIGPNLADSLGAKMQKIMEQQLRLSAHPAAQACLPQPVRAAQALVKGWLFYRQPELPLSATLGVAADHCRGFWCALGDLDQTAPAYAILPRLQWLAPARLALAECLSAEALNGLLEAHFSGADRSPVMVALLQAEHAGDGSAWEYARGFVVADDWRDRAAEFMRYGIVHV